MSRCDLFSRADAVLLREHGCERLHLHLAEARQRRDPLPQVVAVAGLGPESRRVAAVLLGDESGELLHARGHRAGKTVDGRLLAERRDELLGVGASERLGVDRAEALFDLLRAGERRLDGDLLVEREPDE